VVLLAAVAMTAMMPPPAMAQAPAGNKPTAPPPPATPDGARVSPYRQTLRMIMSREGQEQQIGTLSDELTATTAGGTPVLIRVQQITTNGRGTMTDTSVATAASLAPRWHSSHGPNRTLRVEFAPGRVRGSEQPRGGEATAIDQVVGTKIFDSNMLDVLVASLPLSATYKGRIPVYVYEAGGETPVDVAVVSSESLNGDAVWVVGVMLGGRVAMYYVTKVKPRVVQIVSQPAPGIELKFIP
jgi:hypothetical protein